MNSSLAFDVRSQCPLTASIKRRQNVFTAASPGRREKAASPTPLVQLPCPGATFAKGVSLSWHPRPPRRQPTACWPGPLLSQAVLASSPLLGGVSASLRRLLGISAPLDGQVKRADTGKQNKREKKRDKG